MKSSPTLKITTPFTPRGMPWWVTHSIPNSASRRSSVSRRTVCTPGMTRVPLPVTILKPRLSLTASLGVCSRSPEMISASFGSATRHMSLKTNAATTRNPTIPRIRNCMVHLAFRTASYILVTTTVRGGWYSTTTMVVPRASVASPSEA